MGLFVCWSGLYQCVFSNDETMHLCYDIGRGNGEPLILFWILLQFVVCRCGICYFDVFLSSRLGVYALVLWWLWCCIFTCAVPLYFYINKSFYLYLKKKRKKKEKKNPLNLFRKSKLFKWEPHLIHCLLIY